MFCNLILKLLQAIKTETYFMHQFLTFYSTLRLLTMFVLGILNRTQHNLKTIYKFHQLNHLEMYLKNINNKLDMFIIPMQLCTLIGLYTELH